MPCICNFEGIYIYMYYNDHMPPHFHAFYGEHEVIILISTLTVERGSSPTQSLSWFANGLNCILWSSCKIGTLPGEVWPSIPLIL